jgi:hypothetical protein
MVGLTTCSTRHQQSRCRERKTIRPPPNCPTDFLDFAIMDLHFSKFSRRGLVGAISPYSPQFKALTSVPGSSDQGPGPLLTVYWTSSGPQSHSCFPQPPFELRERETSPSSSSVPHLFHRETYQTSGPMGALHPRHNCTRSTYDEGSGRNHPS